MRVDGRRVHRYTRASERDASAIGLARAAGERRSVSMRLMAAALVFPAAMRSREGRRCRQRTQGSQAEEYPETYSHQAANPEPIRFPFPHPLATSVSRASAKGCEQLATLATVRI